MALTVAMAGLSSWVPSLHSLLRSVLPLDGKGVMQNHYEEVFRNVPNAQLQLSFAGTLMELFVDLMGPVFQVLSSRYGIRPVLVLGSLVSVLGLELAGFTTQIWHLYLTQGVLFGAGASLLYVAAMSVPAQWFNKRRGLGLSMVSSGAGVGGVVLPFLVTEMNKKLDSGWTYRILGFVCLAVNVITCLLIKEKYPQQPAAAQQNLREIFDFGILKDTNFLIWVISTMISVMGYFVPFFFLPSYATHLGLSNSDGTSLTAVMAACTCVGRIGIGYISDTIGRINALILGHIVASLAAFLIWVFADNFGVLMAFAVVFGLVCSSYFALMSPITATIVGIDRFPTGLSVLLLTNMIPVFGPTIASAIETRVSSEPYFSYKMFTGVTFMLGAIILIFLKLKMTKAVLSKI
ncbi:major facilitator superfamily domain-containing protein [Zychaea mexicana]|uniref:major facilitator superfamily domain-containing protein n=1 Tax=Zychaea mexicana TaxID=64656 RepID=UPI0022FEFC13|nr:major facilitator superfamily domain-containing protein [Zychaea mexicana]KAI9496817.1 major facilitator superfamily domain-containing protein [Zychaea mexicana]